MSDRHPAVKVNPKSEMSRFGFFVRIGSRRDGWRPRRLLGRVPPPLRQARAAVWEYYLMQEDKSDFIEVASTIKSFTSYKS